MVTHRKSVFNLRVRDFLRGLLKGAATGGASAFKKPPTPRALNDLPYKLIFEISQTISQLASNYAPSEHERLQRQLAHETELIKEFAEDIFILLNCPHQLRIEFKRAAERMSPFNERSQLAMMDVLFQALAWDDPNRRRPKIKRSDTGQLISVTPAALVPARKFNPRAWATGAVIAVPVSALIAYVWGLMGTEQDRYLGGSYFVSWAAWYVMVLGSAVFYVLTERLKGPMHHQGDGG